MIGQTAKPLAEQQASAAEAKSREAAQASAAATALAAKADGDAKVALQAAAAAAGDAQRALASSAAARASAGEANKAAEAAKKSDANAQKFNAEAGADAMYAGFAAADATSAAAQVDRDATEAERDAISARSAATAAESAASGARTAADEAERDASTAETTAVNADGAASEAEKAATNAEEEDRKELGAEQAAMAQEGSPDSGPSLSESDEYLLRTECGESCVDDYRSAKALAYLDVADWVKQNGGEILLGVIGIPDFRRCLSKGDVESCLWSLVKIASLVAVVGKAPAVGKAIWRVSSGIAKFFEDVSQAKHTLDRLRKLLELLRKGATPAQCLLSLASNVGGAVSLSAMTAPLRASLAVQAAPKICMKSSIGKDSVLTKEARKAGRNMDAQKDFDHLFEELSKGNGAPGLYNKVLEKTKGVRYARGRNGGRLFFRTVEGGVEIVGKADKGNEFKVIARLEKIFAK